MMDIKNTAITAAMVIQSLVKLLENEDVDISSVKFKVGSEGNDYESPEFELEKLIDLAVNSLDEIKQANGVPEGFILVPIECTDEIAEAIAFGTHVCGGVANDVYESIIKVVKEQK